MTSFKIDSIVQNDGSIVIPTPPFSPGTTVHVVVTAEPESAPDSTAAPSEAVHLAIQDADQRYAETFRKLAE